MKIRLVLLAAALLACSSAAFALPCQSFGDTGRCHYSVTIPGPLPIPGSFDFDLPGFDPALGTLTAAVIRTTVLVEGLASLTNIAPEPWDIHETFRSISVLMAPGLWMIAQDSYFDVVALAVPPGDTVLIPFSRLDGSPFEREWTDPGLLVPLVPATFVNAPFEGVSGTGMPFELSGWVDHFTVTLDYDYRLPPPAPIPEPSSALLLVVGFSGLLALRHRS